MVSEIKTDRLLIRPRELSDIDGCIAMDRDPLVTKFIDGPWNDPELHRSFVLGNMAKTNPVPFGYWAIARLKSLEEFLGWIMIIPTDNSLAEAEIGWRLTRQCWGQGIAKEAASKVLELVSNHYPNTEIFAVIHSANSGSIKVAQKIGLSFSHQDARNNNLEHIYTSKSIS